MEQNLYPFNFSQDVINLQTKYSLFNRVANIVFCTTYEGGFDHAIMEKAIDLLIARNDCLRLHFVKKGGKIFQYFDAERHLGPIPFKQFKTNSALKRFTDSFRKKMISPYKGRAIDVVFAQQPSGEEAIYFKVSHFAVDTYGIGVILTDLFAVYEALKAGKELPAEPGKFETLLQKAVDYNENEEAVSRDRDFFNEYYVKTHPDRPMYCGIHGDSSDLWLKQKRKGQISCNYLFIKCDTEGYRFVLPGTIGRQVEKWCADNAVTMSAFFFYCICVACSKVNSREKHQLPLMLLDNRGTLAERKAAGTLVQAISVYTTVDWEKSFLENIKSAFDDLNKLYRHTKLTYLEVEALQHKLWNYSMLSQITNLSYSFIPMVAPKGVTMQVLSNGKGALVTYLALMYNPTNGRTDVVYDVQTRHVSPAVLADFNNNFVDVVEKVLADSSTPLNRLF